VQPTPIQDMNAVYNYKTSKADVKSFISNKGEGLTWAKWNVLNTWLEKVGWDKKMEGYKWANLQEVAVENDNIAEANSFIDKKGEGLSVAELEKLLAGTAGLNVNRTALEELRSTAELNDNIAEANGFIDKKGKGLSVAKLDELIAATAEFDAVDSAALEGLRSTAVLNDNIAEANGFIGTKGEGLSVAKLDELIAFFADSDAVDSDKLERLRLKADQNDRFIGFDMYGKAIYKSKIKEQPEFREVTCDEEVRNLMGRIKAKVNFREGIILAEKYDDAEVVLNSTKLGGRRPRKETSAERLARWRANDVCNENDTEKVQRRKLCYKIHGEEIGLRLENQAYKGLWNENVWGSGTTSKKSSLRYDSLGDASKFCKRLTRQNELLDLSEWNKVYEIHSDGQNKMCAFEEPVLDINSVMGEDFYEQATKLYECFDVAL